jgi:hypothetical protein
MYYSAEESDTIFLNFWVNNRLWLTKNLFLTFSTVHMLPKTSESFCAMGFTVVRFLAPNAANS